MKVVRCTLIEGRGYQLDASAYSEYLATIRDQLPANALAFASAAWHYDHKDSRCLHDSWVESIEINEVGHGTRNQFREIAIETKLLGAYHDGHITLLYTGVRSYRFESIRTETVGDLRGHGDLLIDEVSISGQGSVLHEVRLVRANWLIESDDITYVWTPIRE